MATATSRLAALSVTHETRASLLLRRALYSTYALPSITTTTVALSSSPSSRARRSSRHQTPSRHYHYHARSKPFLSRSSWKYTPWYHPHSRLWLRSERGELSHYCSTGKQTRRDGEDKSRNEYGTKAETRSKVEAPETDADKAFYVHADRQLNEQLDRLRLLMEKDPYKVFFGRTERVWNPFGRIGERWFLHKGEAEKELSKDETVAKSTISSSTAEHSHDGSTPIPSRQAEDYYIDPISLRKVPRPPVGNETAPTTTTSSMQTSVSGDKTKAKDIPVEKYQHQLRMSDLGKDEMDALFPSQKLKGLQRSDIGSEKWLKREGFAKSPYHKPADVTADSRFESAAPFQRAAFDPLKRTPSTNISKESTFAEPARPKEPPSAESTGIVEQGPSLQTTIDRMNKKASDTISSLQNAIDEFSGGKATSSSVVVEKPRTDRMPGFGTLLSKVSPLNDSLAENQVEDLDQLRAEDIRAAARRSQSKQPEPTEVKDWYSERLARAASEAHNTLEFPKPASRNPEVLIPKTIDGLAKLATAIMKTKQQVAEIHSREGRAFEKWSKGSKADFKVTLNTFKSKVGSIKADLKKIAGSMDPEIIENAAKPRNQGSANVSKDQVTPDISTKVPKKAQAMDSVIVENSSTVRQDWVDETALPPATPGFVATNPIAPSQSTTNKSKQTPDKPTPALHSYRILAIDEMNNDVISVAAKSSLVDASETPKTPASIFMTLERPERFINQMQRLEDDGYELVDGDRRMLVFKKSEADAGVVSRVNDGPKLKEHSGSLEQAPAPSPSNSQSQATAHVQQPPINTTIPQSQNQSILYPEQEARAEGESSIPPPPPPPPPRMSRRLRHSRDHGYAYGHYPVRFRRSRRVIRRLFKIVANVIGYAAVFYVFCLLFGPYLDRVWRETRERGRERRKEER